MVRGGPSLNPRGRPKKGFTAGDIVASHLSGDEVVRRIVALLDHLSEKGQNTREQVQLLTLLASYTLGRPVTTIDLNVGSQEDAWVPPAMWSQMGPHERSDFLDGMRQRALAGVIDVADEDEDDDDDEDHDEQAT